MAVFGDCFIRYSKYLNENGSEKNYIEICEMYRRAFLDALIFAEPNELALLIHEHQFAVHMNDGWALYNGYFESGGRNQEVLSDFCEFLWFWGDFEDELLILRKYMESGCFDDAVLYAKELCCNARMRDIITEWDPLGM